MKTFLLSGKIRRKQVECSWSNFLSQILHRIQQSDLQKLLMMVTYEDGIIFMSASNSWVGYQLFFAKNVYTESNILTAVEYFMHIIELFVRSDVLFFCCIYFFITYPQDVRLRHGAKCHPGVRFLT